MEVIDLSDDDEPDELLMVTVVPNLGGQGKKEPEIIEIADDVQIVERSPSAKSPTESKELPPGSPHAWSKPPVVHPSVRSPATEKTSQRLPSHSLYAAGTPTSRRQHTATEDSDAQLAVALQNEELERFVQIAAPRNGVKEMLSDHTAEPLRDLDSPFLDVHELFRHYNFKYFSGLLGAVTLKWSSRMTLCAGLCIYSKGKCEVRLSEALLKFRPQSDVVNTLLHEMIHAFLFALRRNTDHDGHGSEFLFQMHRINRQEGTSITVYHNFNEEVDFYRAHWWRCDGPCAKKPPFFGIVKRAMNRPPSPRDYWFARHQQTCGGTFHKIREPEKPARRVRPAKPAKKSIEQQKKTSEKAKRRCERRHREQQASETRERRR